MLYKNLISKLLVLLALFPTLVNSQSFIESADGTEVNSNFFSGQTRFYGSVNTKDENIQFRAFFKINKDSNIFHDRFINVSVKGKASDGISTLFNNGNFNVGTSYSLGYSKIGIFQNTEPTKEERAKGIKFSDFGTISVGYDYSKLTLFNPDTVYKAQISDKTFTGFTLSLNYNMLLSGQNLVSIYAGYRRQNNGASLQLVEIRETNSFLDSTSGTIRSVSKVTNARKGVYKEFDKYPVTISYTRCPSENSTEKDQLKFGYTLYYSCNFGKNLPSANIGGIVFLTKIDKEGNGVRAPIIGFNVQATDFFDVASKNNGLQKRISFGLTTAFPIGK